MGSRVEKFGPPTPAQVTPAELSPAQVTPARTPTHMTPARTPTHMTPARTPTQMTPSRTPTQMTPSRTPAHSSPARTPAHSTPAQVTPAYSTPAHLTPSGTPRGVTPHISSPNQYNSPSLSRSPLLSFNGAVDDDCYPTSATTPSNKYQLPAVNVDINSHNSTPTRTSRPRTPMFITPLASPLRKAFKMTKLDPHDAWLPITESRNGNAYYAAFHTLCSGIGVQALILPVAFTVLGWTWGVICLTLTFIWQLYTLYMLVQLHENYDDGLRYSRYMSLANSTFGERLSSIMVFTPIMNLSAGTCVPLIIIGGSTLKIFFQIVCEPGVCTATPLTTVEWYLVFTCVAVVLSQLPNLNSIAGVSLLGGITAFGYCSLIWTISVAKGRLPSVSYDPIKGTSDIKRAFSVLNALGIIAFAFRGHNLILEIQATMPSSEKHPARVPMWKGVKVAYLLIAMSLFPLAIGGYWAYGQLIAQQGSMLTALYAIHGRDTSRFILGLTSILVIVNALSSFQIYGMPTFDDLESKYTIKNKRPCPWWLRSGIRAFFGFVCFFIAVALPFLSSFAGLLGGISLPVTLAYPSFMWAVIRKPKTYGPIWWLSWGLGLFGMALSVLVTTAGIYSVINSGVQFKFFHPQ